MLIKNESLVSNGTIADLTPDEFVAEMLRLNITRGYFTFINGQFHLSHEALHPMGEFIQNSADFQEHEGIFFQVDEETQAVFVASVHRTNRGAGHGGTRMKQYDTIGNLVTDVMRLAKGMTDKNACAGLWWGGGKAVIYPPKDPRTIKGMERERIFANYGRFIASLNGVYLCAEDMNTSPEDMRVIHTNNRFCTCLPEEIGGSSNPSSATARGVYRGLLAGIHFLEGKNNPNDTDLTGKHILVQGAGNVGWRLLEHLVKSGAKVTVFELQPTTQRQILERFPADQVTLITDADALYEIEADVFSPNAIGAILNDVTIPKLKVKMVAGGANNQLQDPVKHAKMLHESGILYVPDFIINRMGIVNCANEPNGYLPEEVEKAADNVYPDTMSLLISAKDQNQSPQFEALELADRLSRVEHPILGHRGVTIIKHLMANGWGNSEKKVL